MLFSSLDCWSSVEAKKMNLTDTVDGEECARFISKAKIVECASNHRIPIPDDGQYFRTQGGEVKFFENKILTAKNGFVIIPKEAKYISFPFFRNRGGHMVYGEPYFYQN